MTERMQDGGWLEYSVRGVRVVCIGSCDGTGANGCPICADDARTVARRDAEWREAVARVRMLHSASCLRWIRNDESQPCSCDDTTKIHNAALDALLAAMEGA